MTRQIIVHQLNAVGVSPAEFIRISGDNQAQGVTLFTNDGSNALPRSNSGLTYPVPVTPEMTRDVRNALKDHGMALDAVEFFPLTDDIDLTVYVPAMALGAELGAKRISSHIFIRDDVLVVDKLGKLCDLAAKEGLTVTSEFCPLTPGNPSLARATWLVDQVGSARFRIGVDSLHLIRSGATVADVAALDPSYIGVVQINDSHGLHTSSDYISEVHNREAPGRGDLPLKELIAVLPAAMPLEVEVPAAHRRAAGVSAAEHVRDCIDGTRDILAAMAVAGGAA